MKRQSHCGAWQRTTVALGGLALLAVAAAAAAQTQVYKWKDAHGQVHYSDTPPPQGAQVLESSARAPVDPALPSHPKQKTLPPGYQTTSPQPAAPSTAGTSPPPAAPSGPVRAQIKVPPDAATVQAPPAGTAPSDF